MLIYIFLGKKHEDPPINRAKYVAALELAKPIALKVEQVTGNFWPMVGDQDVILALQYEYS